MTEFIQDFSQYNHFFTQEILKNNYSQPDSFKLFETIITTLKNNGHNPFEKNDLNDLLPIYDRFLGNSFSVSEEILLKIKNLLELGFRFDENNYSFNGKDLFSIIKESKKPILSEIISPYLNKKTTDNKIKL